MIPKAIIFDVDGTLAETEELHRRAFNDSFAQAQLPWEWTQELYAELLQTTGGKERIRRYIDVNGARPALEDDAIARLHARKTAAYGTLVSHEEVALRPGIKRILQECRESGVRLAIATTTSLSNVHALLEASLGDQPFEVIAAGDEVAAKKPAPEIYALALARLGLPPEQCVAVEDTLNGLLSATGAGLPCLVTVSLYGGFGPFPGALAVVNQLGDEAHPMRVLAGPQAAGPVVDLQTLSAWLAARRAPV